MVQTSFKEKMESYDQEIQSIKKEMSKIPIIENTLIEISKNMEKQKQMMLHIMESAAQDCSVMSEKLCEILMHNSTGKNVIKGEGFSSKETETRKEERRCQYSMEMPIFSNDFSNDRNKFKKVEMPIFNGDDPDSWLF